METETTNTPTAWIGCLSCYNDGKLIGKWITAEQAANDNPVTYCGLAEIITTGDYTAPRCVICFGDEFDLFDSEYLPSYLRNTCDFYEAAEQLAELNESGDLDRLNTLAAWLMMENLDDLIRYDLDNYCGEWATFKDYAEDYAEQVGDLDAMPEHLRPYFDYQAYSDDLENNYYHDATTGHTWRSV